MEPAADTRLLVLVEGRSDAAAVEALAVRSGHDLAQLRVEVASIGGAHAIGRVLRGLPPALSIAGLCDDGEVDVLARALERSGRGRPSSASELESRVDRTAFLESLGFYVCRPDLEGELIRALGPEGVEEVLDRSGKLGSFRTFQKQPQWQGRPVDDQLRRFLGSSAGKVRHAPLLAEAVPLESVPRPLAALLAHVARTTG